MDERTGSTSVKDDPASTPVPGTTTEPGDAGTAESTEEAEKQKEKEPEIAISQVPMDGICGGY